jgi:hypothetical protein
LLFDKLQVARRKGPDGKLLSMGFGFVETDSEAAAKAAIKALQVTEMHAPGMGADDCSLPAAV